MFKKWLSILVLTVLLISPVQSLTLNGGISCTVDSARYEAFSNVNNKIQINNYKEFFNDKYFLENIKNFKKGKFKYKNRYITLFQSNNYAVTYKNNETISYYYNPNGTLEYIQFSGAGSYPKKSIMYNSFGVLDSISFSVSPSEQYVFDTNKKLIAHWIDENCYDENGNIISRRERLH